MKTSKSKLLKKLYNARACCLAFQQHLISLIWDLKRGLEIETVQSNDVLFNYLKELIQRLEIIDENDNYLHLVPKEICQLKSITEINSNAFSDIVGQNILKKFCEHLKSFTQIEILFNLSIKEIYKSLEKIDDYGQTYDQIEGWSALHYAASIPEPKILELILLKTPNQKMETNDGHTALHIAVGFMRLQNVNIFLENIENFSLEKNKGDILKNILHVAVSCSTSEIVRQFLQKKFDPNEKDKHGQTPLHLIAEKNRVLFISYRHTSYRHASEKVTLLLHAGAKVVIKNKENKTPLDLALERRNFEIYKPLIKANIWENPDVVKSNFIDEESEILNFWGHCQEEVKKMKVKKITGTTFLFYNLSEKNRDKLVGICRNEHVETLLKNGKLKEEFPLYGGTLISNLKKGMAIKNTEDNILVGIRNISLENTEHPECFVSKENLIKAFFHTSIFSYLKEEERQTLDRAVNGKSRACVYHASSKSQ